MFKFTRKSSFKKKDDKSRDLIYFFKKFFENPFAELYNVKKQYPVGMKGL